MNKLIISIEGNIGSGKSTFISFLKENFDDICFVDEPVKEWTKIVDEDNNNLIQNFYKDKKKYGYLFQNFAYITRIKKLNDAIKNSKKKIIITERSIESDKYLFAEMLYEDGYISKLEWNMYLEWFNYFKTNIDKIIYIKTSVDNCMKRINRRDRSGEDKIERKYIENLHKKHENWLSDKDNVITLDGNDNIYEEKILHKYLKLFSTVINQN